MVSRVTEQTLIGAFTLSVSRLRRQQADAQNTVSSQKRLQEASDDPVGAARSTALRGEQAQLQTYDDSVGIATTNLGAQDGALSSAEDIMTRAREIAASLTGGLATPEARQTAAQEVTELERGLLSLGNTTVAGRYVFGALTTSGPVFKSLDDPTFAPNTAYTGPTATFSVQVGPNESARVTTNGGQVFDSSIQALDDLRQTLLAGDPPTANLTPLQNAAEDLRQEDASVGGRMARLQARHTEIGNAVLTSKTVLSGVEDADLTESITKLAQVQNALQATLTAGQTILQTSILDFLRL